MHVYVHTYAYIHMDVMCGIYEVNGNYNHHIYTWQTALPNIPIYLWTYMAFTLQVHVSLQSCCSVHKQVHAYIHDYRVRCLPTYIHNSKFSRFLYSQNFPIFGNLGTEIKKFPNAYIWKFYKTKFWKYVCL